jgi:hypothetical protein
MKKFVAVLCVMMVMMAAMMAPAYAGHCNAVQFVQAANVVQYVPQAVQVQAVQYVPQAVAVQQVQYVPQAVQVQAVQQQYVPVQVQQAYVPQQQVFGVSAVNTYSAVVPQTTFVQSRNVVVQSVPVRVQQVRVQNVHAQNFGVTSVNVAGNRGNGGVQIQSNGARVNSRTGLFGTTVRIR